MEGTFVVNLGIHLLEAEITSRCNLSCKHCYNRRDKKIDMPVNRVLDIFNFAERNKIWMFVVTGGEASIHPSFPEISKYIAANKKNCTVALQTNGAAADKDTDLLRAYDLIHISYDMSKGVRPDSDRNLVFAKKLQKAGIKCYFFTTIHNENQELIENMVEEANKLNIPIGFNVCLNTDQANKKLIMSKSDFAKTEKKLYELFQAGKTMRYTSPLTAIFDNRKAGKFKKIRGGCIAGIASGLITPAGDFFPCPFFRISAGNIYDKSIEEIWLNSGLLNKIRDRQLYDEPCGSCEKLSYCGGCRNRAFISSNKANGADPMCYKS